MISKEHPYHFIAPLLDKTNSVFQLSRYVYMADSLLDEREYLSVHSREFTEEWVATTIRSLAVNQELALHSKILVNGRTWHIPMIDFAIEGELSEVALDRLRLFSPKSVRYNMAVFASGRSFHAYSTTLLSPKEWLAFMGRLLLINPKQGKEIIDSRWIGHRLIGGFCALRWSDHSGMYRGEPSRLAIPI